MARRSGARRSLLDLLTARFTEYTRDELYRSVMCGEVRVNGGTEIDPRARVPVTADLELVMRRFVSRGGEKLDAALAAFGLFPAGRVWLDAGASTGGFTDCLLQHGATTVHAVDVGYNQLAYTLRRDPRVVVRERTNVGSLRREDLSPPPDAAVCDLSFRSLRGVLRNILCLTSEGWGIALLKPQFEIAAEHRWSGRSVSPEKHALERGSGVVGGAVREAVVARVRQELTEKEGVAVHAAVDSPVAGKGGNREVLLLVGLIGSRELYTQSCCKSRDKSLPNRE